MSSDREYIHYVRWKRTCVHKHERNSQSKEQYPAVLQIGSMGLFVQYAKSTHQFLLVLDISRRIGVALFPLPCRVFLDVRASQPPRRGTIIVQEMSVYPAFQEKKVEQDGERIVFDIGIYKFMAVWLLHVSSVFRHPGARSMRI